MNDTTIYCPDCRGSGRLTALVDFADRRKSGPYEIECRRCKGDGVVDRQQEEWMRIGSVHRTWRVAQHESVRDCAFRLFMTSSELSDMEHGRRDPSRLIADTPEELQNAR